MAISTIVVVAAWRPYPGETVSGDAWHVDWHAERCRLAVIDGLGHGPAAAAAADAARAALASRPDLDPTAALRECHAALQRTRGAAIWIGTVDPGVGRIQYAGAGNVDARLWQSGRSVALVGQRGIVGATLPNLRTYSAALEDDWTLLVYTDGIRDRMLEASELDGDPQQLADRLLLDHARATDDALIVVARGGLRR